MPSCLAIAFGGGAVVAGQHDDLDAVACQRFQRRGRRRLHGIGNREHTGQLAVDCDVDDGGPVIAQVFG